MNYTIDSESAEFALEDFNFKITASNIIQKDIIIKGR